MIELNLRSFGFLLLALLPLVLTGCGGDVDVAVDFYHGESWRAVTVLSVPAEALSLAGGASEIEGHLDELVATAAADGVHASWEKTEAEGNLVYTVEMKGKGLDTLSRTVFDGEAEIYVDESTGRRLIHFSQYVSSGFGFASQTITLRGGEIVAGNGRLVDDHTITWENPSGQIEATLTERSRLGLGSVLGAVAAIVVTAGLVVGGVQLWKRSRSLPSAPCSWCGFCIPEGARHCPGCGRRR